MGCCFSSAERDPHAQNPSRPDLSPPNHPARPCSNTDATRAAATLEAEEEEEAVKEVLSETPLPKPHPPPQTTTGDNAECDARFLPKLRECAPEAQTPTGNKEEDVAEIVSECSELCSVGESFSTASATTATTATTVAEKKETEVTSREKGEVTQRVIKRSPMKVQRKRPYSGEQTARRAGRSPAKKPELSRTAAAATQQRSRMGTTTAALRRDQSDGLGRRSRSPAARNGCGGRRSGVGGSPLKKTGNAGGRSAATSAGDVDKKDLDEGRERGDDGDSKQGNESVDNPLVSLECFIFL